MRGLIVTKEHELKLVQDIPMPEINEYEALVKVETCMICNGTDLGVIAGHVREASDYPLVLGHESAGRVVKVGIKVTAFRLGDLVVRPTQKVSDRYSIGWGGFSEYAVVKDYLAIVRDGADIPDASLGITQQVVPEGITAEQASLLITFKETYSQVKRIGAAQRKNMVIIGDGPVGLSVLTSAKLLNVSEVYMIGNHRKNLELALEMGATAVYCGKDPHQKQLADEKLSGKIELCLDTVGRNTTINQGCSYLKEDGIVAIYGLHTKPTLSLRLPMLRNYAIRFIQWPIPEEEAAVHDEVCAAILDGRINTEVFISHRLPLEDFEIGFQAIRDRRARKVTLFF